MNEAVTKRFLLYFRLMMLVWILIANAFFHVCLLYTSPSPRD